MIEYILVLSLYSTSPRHNDTEVPIGIYLDAKTCMDEGRNIQAMNKRLVEKWPFGVYSIDGRFVQGFKCIAKEK